MPKNKRIFSIVGPAALGLVSIGLAGCWVPNPVGPAVPAPPASASCGATLILDKNVCVPGDTATWNWQARLASSAADAAALGLSSSDPAITGFDYTTRSLLVVDVTYPNLCWISWFKRLEFVSVCDDGAQLAVTARAVYDAAVMVPGNPTGPPEPLGVMGAVCAQSLACDGGAAAIARTSSTPVLLMTYAYE